jgi:hypothetical protein
MSVLVVRSKRGAVLDVELRPLYWLPKASRHELEKAPPGAELPVLGKHWNVSLW